MKIEIPDAISLILTLPAQSSGNEGQRKMGERTLDLLFEYRTLGVDDKEKAFNISMIASILSTVRAFGTVYERTKDEWAAIEKIKILKEGLLEVIRNLSPLTRGNYWSKTIVIIMSLGYSLKDMNRITDALNVSSFNLALALIVSILALEIASKSLECLFAINFQKTYPKRKVEVWKENAREQYVMIIKKFIDEALDNYRRHYPGLDDLYGYDITAKNDVKKMKDELVMKHIYL